MRKLLFLLSLCLATLTGCVGFSSGKSKINNASEIIPPETAAQVQTGDTLEKLHQLMGDPTSTGIDESGKPYLRYVMVEQKTKATALQIPGFIHASTYSYPTGYELQIFYEGDKIVLIARKNYVSEPGDNSK